MMPGSRAPSQAHEEGLIWTFDLYRYAWLAAGILLLLTSLVGAVMLWAPWA